jgi:DNA-binding CsgD family transcriptional regulator
MRLRADGRSGVHSRLAIGAIFFVQAACAVFFVSDIVLTLLGTRVEPIPWQVREYLEIAAALGLILGLMFGALALNASVRARRTAERKLRIASGAFLDLVTERFDEWALTPSERDVAMFALKGMSIAEIAALRATSEGTVKAQTAAIYRKAGVTSKAQFFSLFIDDLLSDGLQLPPREAPEPAKARTAS